MSNIKQRSATTNRLHHAFVMESGVEEGVRAVRAWIEKELGIQTVRNPDVVVMQYGLLAVEDARKIVDHAVGVPFAGEKKAVIIAATRVYHEAQNALLKLFEEPPPGTYLFLILPSLGGLLPTLRSRIQTLTPQFRHRMSELGAADVGLTMSHISKATEEFVKANREKRGAMIKRLTNGRDEEERRELRDEALVLVNGIEAAAYAHEGFTKPLMGGEREMSEFLKEISILRGYLYDRSAPVKMILEHISLVLPKNLLP